MTPEQRQEAERLAEALTVPLAGKYISTDDIKKAGEMLKVILEGEPTLPKPKMYQVAIDWLLDWAKTLLVGVIIGVLLAQFFAYDSIIRDCKVMGAFRIGNYSFTCKPNFP